MVRNLSSRARMFTITQIRSQFRTVLLIGAGLFGSFAIAQPTCSFTLGNDTTVCQGQSVPLQAPTGFPSYLWSTGAVGDNISVNSSGIYWCQVSYPVSDLVTNGNFSNGNTGFTTDFTNSTDLQIDGSYFIGTNASNYHPQFVGTGTGNFMIVNSGWPSALYNVWCESVPVCGGQTYTLSYWAQTISNSTPVRLQWWMDGTAVGPEVSLLTYGSGWQNVTQSWTTPAGQTTANICLRAMSGDGVGNDFGIDDISMTGTVVLTDDILVNVTPLPVVDLGPDPSLCTGQSLTLDASVPGGTYVWQDASTGSSFQVTGPGNYNVTVTANNCSASDAMSVTYNPTPVVDLGPDTTLCTGQTLLLDATNPFASYTWQNGPGASTFNVTGPGTYSVNVQMNNCFASDNIEVFYNSLPVVDLGPDTALCVGQSLLLDATTPSAFYEWQDNSTNATFNVTTAGPQSVDVTVDGCTTTDVITITYNPLPVVDLGPDQTVCPGTDVLLDATVPGATYLWQDGSLTATYTATTPAIYSVDVTVNNCTASDAFTLSNYTLQNVDLGPDVTLCEGSSTSLSATVPGATFAWSTGELTNSITVSTAGIYWMDATLNGCVVRDSIAVSVTPLPVVDIGPDIMICPGTTMILDATTAGATYLWNTGAASPTITVGTGVYSVTVTQNNCPATDAIDIQEFAPDPVSLGNDTTLCGGDILVLNVLRPGATYLWQDGSVGSSISVSTNGSASVTLTDANGCISTDQIAVTFIQAGTIDLGNDTTICQGSVLTLNAGGIPGATYLWSTGEVTSSIQVISAGSYAVTVTHGPCTVVDAITVSLNTPPVVDLGADITLCSGQTTTLTAGTAGSTTVWSNGVNTTSITIGTAGVYSVEVTNAAGCVGRDTIAIFITAPNAVDLGPDLSICQGGSILLDATTAGASYLWSTGASTPTITAATSGTYWVQAIQGICTTTDTITITVAPAPVVNLGPDQTLCNGTSATLDATWSGATYLWSNGAVTPTLTATTSATYRVIVTVGSCAAYDTVVVNVITPTLVDLGPDVSLCQGEDVLLDATTAGASYLWSTGASTPTITAATSGTYWVQAIQGICTTTDTVVVTVAPAPVVNLGPDQTLCNGASATLDATWLGATYLWSNGAVTPTLTATTSATYRVIVTVGSCAAYDTVVVNVITPTLVDLGPDVSLCQGEDVLLDATTAGASYLWSTGASTPTITAATSGTYWVQAIQGICTTTDTVVVTVAPAPVVNLGPDQTLCNGTSATLDATWPGATYLWSNGAVTPTLTATTSATFSVIVTVGSCAAYDTVIVNVITPTLVDLGLDVSLCQGEDVLLDATTTGASYLWSTGASTPTITAATSGAYWVQAIQGICTTTDTVIVTVAPAPVVDLGPDQTLCNGTSATLDATWPGATYLCSNGAVTPTLTAATSATFSVIVTVGSCAAYDTVVVNVITPTLVDLGPDVSLCQGEDVLLNATNAGASYLWSTGASTPTITAATSGTYWVQSIQGACIATDTVVVTILTNDLVDLGADQLLCSGETSVMLDATLAGATYSWNTGALTPTLLVSTNGIYAVEVTVNGCSSVDTVQIEFGTLFIDLGPDTLLCPGASVVLDLGLPNGTNTWNGTTVAATFTVSAAGTYWVEHVPLAGCAASDTIVVTYAQGNALDLGADLELCAGETATLDATLPGATYLWDNASTSATRSVSMTGTYSVIATVGQCALYDTVSVVFNPLPVVEIGPDVSICPGTTTTYDATIAGSTYLWNDGSTGATYTSGNAVNVTVEVTVNGCTVTDNAVITILEAPVLELGSDTTLCEGTTLLLDVTQTNSTYLWSTGSTQPALMVDMAGTYSVEVTRNGCMVTDAIDVEIFMTSTFTIGTDVVLCPGESVVLDANQPNAQHTWSTGASADAISVNGEGIYWVNVVMAGCSASDTVEVRVVDLPSPDLGADIISCEGLTVPLSVDPGDVQLVWSTGSTLAAIDVDTEGAYSVTYSLEGCSATDVINISFNDSITSLEIGPEAVICPGQFVNLTVPEINGMTYLWSNGSTAHNTTVDAAGIYTLSFTGLCALGTEQIEVLTGDCDTYVHVPNTFSPNNDDINDVFLPVVSGNVENYELQIFDRWGELIFTTSDPTVGWDGSVISTIAQEGVYVWKIRYRNNLLPKANSERIIGHVTLLR